MQYCDMLRFSLIAFLSSGIFLGRAYFDYLFLIVAAFGILAQSVRDDWANEDAMLAEESDGAVPARYGEVMS